MVPYTLFAALRSMLRSVLAQAELSCPNNLVLFQRYRSLLGILALERFFWCVRVL